MADDNFVLAVSLVFPAYLSTYLYRTEIGAFTFITWQTVKPLSKFVFFPPRIAPGSIKGCRSRDDVDKKM